MAAAGDSLSLRRRLALLNWPLVVLLCLVAGVGVAMLYSAGDGSWEPWAARQVMRFGVALVLMLAVALVDLRFWLRHAYTIYFAAVALLVAVEVAGATGMGAQRWIDLGVVRLQPSELMKIALILGLARYFHGLSMEDIGRPGRLAVPLLMILAPAFLVLRQPDLGTAAMLAVGGAAIFFVVGVRLWKFGLVGLLGLAALPVAWNVLRPYQQQRILTFFDPESDPLGAGYHILQAKIALGSGGVFGKGYMQGSQAHLEFLPERQTDFIFTMLAEEFGLVGGLSVLGLFLLLFVYGIAIAVRIRNQFGRVVAIGV
ncbi:MAG: FtsW/RodA/SpoVE family cell cycle protein, partial [Defluviicoccus sp.]|nr:FtsW/RodA/SpoVE family cell cycle protein [Defluviicoccus sp.]